MCIYIYIYRSCIILCKNRKLILPKTIPLPGSFIAFIYKNNCINSIISSLFYYIHPVLRD